MSDLLDVEWFSTTDTRTPEEKKSQAVMKLRKMRPDPNPKSDVRFREVSADEFERDDLLRLLSLMMERIVEMQDKENARFERISAEMHRQLLEARRA